MLGLIRPVGEAIHLDINAHPASYNGYYSHYFCSGTQALQSAIEQACKLTETTAPEVIIPAYACPDLISACVGAGVRPRLVDLEPNTPFPCFRQISDLKSKHTVAVILVNFLGIAPPSELFDKLNRHDLVVIEDRAQSYTPPENAHELMGDYVIFSYGKGKPVSILGGGQLLIKKKHKSPEPKAFETSAKLKLKFKLKAFVYNIIIRPVFYSLLVRFPLVKVGVTSYKQPLMPTPLGSEKISLLGSNIEHQHKINQLAQEKLLAISKNSGLPSLVRNGKETRLLRFPFLAPNKQERDILISELYRNGISASAMYNRPLNEILGTPLSTEQKKHNFEAASDFADRLITLPCHSDVDLRTIGRIEYIFDQHVNTKSADQNTNQSGLDKK